MPWGEGEGEGEGGGRAGPLIFTAELYLLLKLLSDVSEFGHFCLFGKFGISLGSRAIESLLGVSPIRWQNVLVWYLYPPVSLDAGV